MNKPVLAAALTLALAATGANAEIKFKPSPSDNDPAKITVSCYRGPLKEVAWDRPNAVFIDDLVQLGYTLSEASWLGERVCRDEYGVFDPAYLEDRFRQLIAQNPPHR
ncbi:MAG: hypothetical protein ACWA5A_16415 [Marinibacterium sp.]